MYIGLFDPDWRGHHTPYVDLLSRYFIEEGHCVTFVTDERHERLDELPDADRLSVVTRSLPGKPQAPANFLRSVKDQYFQTRQLQTTLQIAERRRFDILHLLYFDRRQIPLRLATLSGSDEVPMVATLHRDAFVTTADSDPFQRVIGAAVSWALDTTLDDGILDILTVHTDEIRDRIVDAVPSATAANVRTIPAPTPKPDVSCDIIALRDDLNLPTERDILLFFGSLRHEKGPDILANQLGEVDRPLTVVFAGSPVDFSTADIEEWKHTVGNEVDIIDRLEYIPEEDVDRYFAAVDATVLPYRRERGISGPLRRSAMAGTPVIGTADTDVGRLIERHELGATFDPNNRPTFDRALGDTLDAAPALRSALDAFASSRHWERTGEILVDIYNEVLEA